ncbi:MAG TPA: hypothetical protein VHQ70_09495 [Syntrophomonadaceae bacterium]|nr:hypothetical protein [Syntrophomonadaceae bacterium]
MFKTDNELPDQNESPPAIKNLLVRLFAFIFFTFIIALVTINRFIEHGRILVMLVIMFPLVLMLTGVVIGLTISKYRTR